MDCSDKNLRSMSQALQTAELSYDARAFVTGKVARPALGRNGMHNARITDNCTAYAAAAAERRSKAQAGAFICGQRRHQHSQDGRTSGGSPSATAGRSD